MTGSIPRGSVVRNEPVYFLLEAMLVVSSYVYFVAGSDGQNRTRKHCPFWSSQKPSTSIGVFPSGVYTARIFISVNGLPFAGTSVFNTISYISKHGTTDWPGINVMPAYVPPVEDMIRLTHNITTMFRMRLFLSFINSGIIFPQLIKGIVSSQYIVGKGLPPTDCTLVLFRV